MSKKHKKDKKKNKKKEIVSDSLTSIFDVRPVKTKTKKKLNKEFKEILDEIEISRIQIYEADKKAKHKERKKINKQKGEFYTDMEAIKCRAKLAKKWEKHGFLDRLLEVFKMTLPIISQIAKTFCSLIITFLSIDKIRYTIKPKTLSKICTAFNVANSL